MKGQIGTSQVRSEILMVVTMKVTIFLNMILCNMVYEYLHFKQTCCLNHLTWWVDCWLCPLSFTHHIMWGLSNIYLCMHTQSNPNMATYAPPTPNRAPPSLSTNWSRWNSLQYSNSIYWHSLYTTTNCGKLSMVPYWGLFQLCLPRWRWSPSGWTSAPN